MTGLKSLERIENEYSIDEAVFYKEDFNQIRKELKALVVSITKLSLTKLEIKLLPKNNSTY